VVTALEVIFITYIKHIMNTTKYHIFHFLLFLLSGVMHYGTLIAGEKITFEERLLYQEYEKKWKTPPTSEEMRWRMTCNERSSALLKKGWLNFIMNNKEKRENLRKCETELTTLCIVEKYIRKVQINREKVKNRQ
jgi:hypothetical protein